MTDNIWRGDCPPLSEIRKSDGRLFPKRDTEPEPFEFFDDADIPKSRIIWFAIVPVAIILFAAWESGRLTFTTWHDNITVQDNDVKIDDTGSRNTRNFSFDRGVCFDCVHTIEE